MILNKLVCFYFFNGIPSYLPTCFRLLFECLGIGHLGILQLCIGPLELSKFWQ